MRMEIKPFSSSHCLLTGALILNPGSKSLHGYADPNELAVRHRESIKGLTLDRGLGRCRRRHGFVFADWGDHACYGSIWHADLKQKAALACQCEASLKPAAS